VETKATLFSELTTNNVSFRHQEATPDSARNTTSSARQHYPNIDNPSRVSSRFSFSTLDRLASLTSCVAQPATDSFESELRLCPRHISTLNTFYKRYV